MMIGVLYVKKCYVLLLVMIGITLVGCAENPALIGLEEVKKPSEISEPEEEQNDEVVYRKKSPADFDVSTPEVGISAVLDKYCWESEEKTCSIEPSDVQKLVEGYVPLDAEKGQLITYRQAIDIERPDFPKFDELRIIQYRMQGEKEVKLVENGFLAPEEEGKYYYLVHLKWNGDLVGEAYYAFSLYVK
jgi:hypothetical protein